MDPQVADQVRRSIAGLDSPQFAERNRAAGQLERLAANPKLHALLAEHFAAVLAAEGTSLEVRACLESLVKQLPPAPKAAGTAMPAADQIDPLLTRLTGDAAIARDDAQRQLVAMLARAELIGPLMTAIKVRLAAPKVTASTWRALAPVLERAREAWVTADPKLVSFPEVSDAELAQVVDEAAAADPPESGPARIHRACAARELIDLVVRDDSRERLLAMIKTNLEGSSDELPALQEAVDFARPAMAAEVWRHQRENWEHVEHITVQHLLVDVPQFPENSTRATHFDKIDDTTAHCTSGNTLHPGDYPVGVGIPHPTAGEEWLYYLVNLPTPRRRLAYEYYLKRDESERLAEITRRTLDYFLTGKRTLDERHVQLLCQLEPHAVSRFVGKYFRTVDDSILSPPMTVHGAMCFMLVRIGRHEAIEALVETARSGRLGRLTADNPYALAWMAALATAVRDPWPKVEPWLAALVSDKTPLVFSDPPAEVGATAAAILLERHGMPPSSFSLEPASEKELEGLPMAGYRFAGEQNRQDVLDWWRKQDAVRQSVP